MSTEPVALIAARRETRSALGRRVLIGLVLAWFALLVLVPSAALVKKVIEGGLAPFIDLVQQPEMRRAFGLTLGVGLLATVVNAVFGVAFALVLVRQRFWGKTLADGVVDLPFAVSPIVAGLMLVVLYGPDGWLGRWLEPHGVEVVYAVPGMVLATLFVTIPFVVREIVPVLQERGTEAEQAAATLGAGPWTIFWRITLPSMRWGLAYGITLSFSRALGEFGAVLVVSGNLIGKTQTATLAVHDGIESFRPEGAYAAAMVLGAASFVLLIGMEALRKRMAVAEDRA